MNDPNLAASTPSPTPAPSASPGDAPEHNSNACGTETAACCANFYEQDIVQELMGGSFHPGGEGLSRKLIESLGLAAKSRVLDVACGVGTTTQMMAIDFGIDATGLDFSKINVQKAAAAAADKQKTGIANDPTSAGDPPCCEPGDSCCSVPELTSLASAENGTSPTPAAPIAGSTRFLHGSADAIPIEDATFEGLTCECAVSTFADQPLVAREFFRVLKSGGVFGMTDMVLNGDLPDDFSEKAAPWTCVAKAMTVQGYQQLFTDAGFEIVASEDHSHTLLELAKDMKRKLVMAGMGKALGALPSLGMSFSEMRAMLAQSTELVKSGTIEYGLLVFRKP